jgi:hypothetical protein
MIFNKSLALEKYNFAIPLTLDLRSIALELIFPVNRFHKVLLLSQKQVTCILMVTVLLITR